MLPCRSRPHNDHLEHVSTLNGSEHMQRHDQLAIRVQGYVSRVPCVSSAITARTTPKKITTSARKVRYGMKVEERTFKRNRPDKNQQIASLSSTSRPITKAESMQLIHLTRKSTIRPKCVSPPITPIIRECARIGPSTMTRSPRWTSSREEAQGIEGDAGLGRRHHRFLLRRSWIRNAQKQALALLSGYRVPLIVHVPEK